MLRPVLRSFHFVGLQVDDAIAHPENCAYLVKAEISPPDGTLVSHFTFKVMTPAYLQEVGKPYWPRYRLIVPIVSRESVQRGINDALEVSLGESWSEILASLDDYMCWEGTLPSA